MGWNSYAEEPDAKPEPILAIPIRRSWILFRIILCQAVIWAVPALLVVCSVAVHPWPDKMPGKRDLGGIASRSWLRICLPSAVAAVMVLAVLFWPRQPEFAVFKDGIKLPDWRHSPQRSIWDRWSYGFYLWSEVSYCRWSRYRKDVLGIHLKAAEHSTDVVLWGTGPPWTRQLPAMIFEYRVPERYRAAVEATIRAIGKWAE